MASSDTNYKISCSGVISLLTKLGLPKSDIEQGFEEMEKFFEPIPEPKQVTVREITKNADVKNYLEAIQDSIYRLKAGSEEIVELLKWHFIIKKIYDNPNDAFTPSRNLMMRDYLNSSHIEHKRKVLLFIIFSFEETAKYVQEKIKLIKE